MNLESITLECKQEFTDDIKKTIIAFANTEGGEIHIGIADDGSVVGVADADVIMLKVGNVARDAIKPDVTIFLRCERKSMQDKEVVVVSVQKGTACPYYLAGKGLRPEGVFVRQGPASVPATESAILKMIKETGGEDFEASRSLVQELTFADAEAYFDEEKLALGQRQMRTLGIIGADGAYTNLGLLLSDQCLHTIKVAVFEGAAKSVFKDRTEIGGSLLQQINSAYSYIDRYNRTRAEIVGLKRMEKRDYPVVAVREALLNAIVHRDYSYSASTLISIFDDRLEFLTLGGLPKGIEISDVLLGVSLPRNKQLANIFYRLHLIEAFGTGILKIKECYAGVNKQPLIENTDNAFKITLYNTNYVDQAGTPGRRLDENEHRIMEALAEYGTATRAELEQASEMSQSSAIRTLKSLLEDALIVKTGNGKKTLYHVKK